SRHHHGGDDGARDDVLRLHQGDHWVRVPDGEHPRRAGRGVMVPVRHAELGHRRHVGHGRVVQRCNSSRIDPVHVDRLGPDATHQEDRRVSGGHDRNRAPARAGLLRGSWCRGAGEHDRDRAQPRAERGSERSEREVRGHGQWRLGRVPVDADERSARAAHGHGPVDGRGRHRRERNDVLVRDPRSEARNMSRRFDDQGQVLGLALAFLTFVAIILAVTLSASGANLDATNQLATQRNQQYAADGAIQAAVNNIRGNPALGADNGQNCDYTTPAAFANSLQVQVSCTPFPGSGTGTASQNRPPYSFLALPTAGSTLEGFFQIPTNGNGGGTSDVNVFGPVASNGIVNETGNGSGQLLIAGNVTAHSCNGDVNVTNTTVYTKVCNSSATIADPGVANPTAYALMSPSAPAMAQAPACLSGAAEFFPGTYNAFPAAPGGCSTKPMWFQPGAYYFDFTGAGSHAWDLSGKTIVGGTPKNWDPTSASTPAPPIGSTGSCRSEHDFPPNAGVQWVFGGDSRISVGSGLLELCAQPSTTQQQLA